MNVSLTDEMKAFVHNKVAGGDFPSEEAVLQQALRRFRDEDQLRYRADAAEPAPSDDLTDYDAIEYCTREVEGKDVPSIEEVRRTLANIHGSMAQAVIEEREDRI
jgi:putative addiction module CopG family antidote